MEQIETTPQELLPILKKKMEQYPYLVDLSAIDYLEPAPHTVLFYLLRNEEGSERISIKLKIAREEKVPSIVEFWEGADWYERELFDLFGVHFIGHPDLKRILMPDDWEGHPLRKDYPLTEEVVEFKREAKPKIPSEVIPNVRTKWTY